MRTMQIDLPDKLADEVEALAQSGWFRDRDDVVTKALLEYVRKNRLELIESQQKADIAWALSQAPQTP